MIAIISAKPSAEASTAAPVMAAFVHSMTTSEPASCVTAVTSVPTLWLMDWPIVSTSFVTRESTSPVDVWLKYAMGSRLIFLEMSERIDRATRCVTKAMIQPCAVDRIRLAAYSAIRNHPARATAAMSISPRKPSEIRSVISERRPGPASVATVPSAANASAAIIAGQYLRQYRASRAHAPLKSRARSPPARGRPGMGPGSLLLLYACFAIMTIPPLTIVRKQFRDRPRRSA